MFRLKLIVSIIFILNILCVKAQDTTGTYHGSGVYTAGTEERNKFNHLDVAVTAGTTGLGAELAMPVSDLVQLRAGFAVMPSVKIPMHFRVGLKNDPETDAEGNKIRTKFDKMSDMFEQITGYKITRNVTMYGRPSYYNAKLLADFFPFRNKKWFLTAGFYYGNSEIARAYNSYEVMRGLAAVCMYNHMHDKVVAGESIMDITVSDVDISYSFNDPDDDFQVMITDKFKQYGRMGIHLGNFKDDDSPYYTYPNENAMVEAKIKANRFKPYLGFGYGREVPQTDKLYNFSFECGFMLWGGTPEIITHDGVDLAKEVYGIRNDVGSYVRFIKGIKVFPVLNLRISRRIF